MRRDLINDDSNQFGPGTDLVICLLAFLMILIISVSNLYNKEKIKNETLTKECDEILEVFRKQTTLCKSLEKDCKKIRELLEKEKEECKSLKDIIATLEDKGSFEHGGEFLAAGTFKQNPYYELRNPAVTEKQVLNIINKYRTMKAKYPYIFIIGHANKVGIAGKPNMSDGERMRKNWQFAGARSAVIASLLQKYLDNDDERNKIIIVSTGEFDLKFPKSPKASENAFVEVFFGNEWKPQSYKE